MVLLFYEKAKQLYRGHKGERLASEKNRRRSLFDGQKKRKKPVQTLRSRSVLDYFESFTEYARNSFRLFQNIRTERYRPRLSGVRPFGKHRFRAYAPCHFQFLNLYSG